LEEWLGRQTALVKPDLDLKHKQMAEAVFPFFRATLLSLDAGLA
jgi:hypothetical protein